MKRWGPLVVGVAGAVFAASLTCAATTSALLGGTAPPRTPVFTAHRSRAPLQRPVGHQRTQWGAVARTLGGTTDCSVGLIATASVTADLSGGTAVAQRPWLLRRVRRHARNDHPPTRQTRQWGAVALVPPGSQPPNDTTLAASVPGTAIVSANLLVPAFDSRPWQRTLRRVRLERPARARLRWADRETTWGSVSNDANTGQTFAAALTGTAAVSPALSTAIRCASSVAGTATVNAALSTQPTLAAAVTGTATTTATLSTAIQPAVALSVTATTAAALATAIACRSALAGVATIAADLSATDAIRASVSGAATVTAALTTGIACAATPIATATIAPALTTVIAPAASLACAATTSGALSTGIACAAAPSMTATVNAALATNIALAAAVLGTAAITPTTLEPDITILHATAFVTADLRAQVQMATSLAGSAQVFAALSGVSSTTRVRRVIGPRRGGRTVQDA